MPEAAVDPDRFLDAEHARWPGHWSSAPSSWAGLPEERLIGAETRELVARAIERLPATQRAVISLRDVEGWDGDEVCNVLGVSESNQRVLLPSCPLEGARRAGDVLRRGVQVSAPVEQLSCQELVELVTDYVDGCPLAGGRARFDEHLGVCEGCRNYLEQMEVTVRVVGRIRPEDLSPEAGHTLLAAFRDWKRSAAAASAVTRAGVATTVDRQHRRPPKEEQ